MATANVAPYEALDAHSGDWAGRMPSLATSRPACSSREFTTVILLSMMLYSLFRLHSNLSAPPTGMLLVYLLG